MKTSAIFSLLFAAGCGAPLHAQSFSADYSNRPATIDSAGGRTTSTAYRNDGSAGGIGGVTRSADYVDKGGYALQLYDVSALLVSASPSTVNEGLARQLGAAQLLDDATRVSVNASSVAWSIDSGPILSISPLGVATAAIVYQNSPATLLGVFQGFTGTATLTVLNVSADDFGLYAGDGLPDEWQVQYFGTDNPAAAPDYDASGTGQSNQFKYVAGLDPLDPNSVFRFRIEAVPGVPTWKNLIFSPRFTDRRYFVEFTVNFPNGPWQVPGSTVESDSGVERTVTDKNALGSRRFYRVFISNP